MKTYVMGLCENRHQMPVKDFIFPEWIPRKISSEELERHANEMIPKDCGRLCLYTTGLTVAILAVVTVCLKRGIHLDAYHFRDGRFQKQRVT